jgi:hypothetical protein
MTLYITKNGQRLGPYTLTEIQALIANGTYHAADWVWYEGLTDWIPLQQVPGIVSTSAPKSVPAMGVTTASTTPDSPVGRPVLVWVICLLYFITIPIGLIALAATPYLLSFSAKIQQQTTDQIQSEIDQTSDPDQKARLTATQDQLKSSQAQVAKAADHGVLYYGFAVVSMIINLVAAILLFMLRRSAWPAFVSAVAVSVLGTTYNFATMSFPQVGGPAQTVSIVAGIIGAAISWGISLAILYYVWTLRRRNILR